MYIYNSTHCRIPCWEICKVLCKTQRKKCFMGNSGMTKAFYQSHKLCCADFCWFVIDSFSLNAAVASDRRNHNMKKASIKAAHREPRWVISHTNAERSHANERVVLTHTDTHTEHYPPSISTPQRGDCHFLSLLSP